MLGLEGIKSLTLFLLTLRRPLHGQNRPLHGQNLPNMVIFRRSLRSRGATWGDVGRRGATWGDAGLVGRVGRRGASRAG